MKAILCILLILSEIAKIRLLAGETRVSTFHDEEIAFRFVVESLDRVCIAGADRAGENAVNRQVPCGRPEKDAC